MSSLPTCGHPECAEYNMCIYAQRAELRYPIDEKSLYANRIYDNQTANRRCYERNPINIIEGFGSGSLVNNLIRLAIFIAIVYVVYMVIRRLMMKEVDLGIRTESMRGGGMMSERVFVENLFN